MSKIEMCDLAMVQDLAIVELYKPRTRKEVQQVLDDEKNKGKDPKKDIMALKEQETKVMYNFQTVKVLAIKPNNGAGIEVGDIVLTDFRALKEFDLQKNAYIVQVYALLAKVRQGKDDI
jgi:hypothetical protein